MSVEVNEQVGHFGQFGGRLRRWSYCWFGIH